VSTLRGIYLAKKAPCNNHNQHTTQASKQPTNQTNSISICIRCNRQPHIHDNTNTDGWTSCIPTFLTTHPLTFNKQLEPTLGTLPTSNKQLEPTPTYSWWDLCPPPVPSAPSESPSTPRRRQQNRAAGGYADTYHIHILSTSYLPYPTTCHQIPTNTQHRGRTVRPKPRPSRCSTPPSAQRTASHLQLHHVAAHNTSQSNAGYRSFVCPSRRASAIYLPRVQVGRRSSLSHRNTAWSRGHKNPTLV